jgi:hypothetical protein
MKRKSAMDTLLDTMRGIIEDGARGMTPKERQESEEKFNAALDRAVASRKRQRESHETGYLPCFFSSRPATERRSPES